MIQREKEERLYSSSDCWTSEFIGVTYRILSDEGSSVTENSNTVGILTYKPESL